MNRLDEWIDRRDRSKGIRARYDLHGPTGRRVKRRVRNKRRAKYVEFLLMITKRKKGEAEWRMW